MANVSHVSTFISFKYLRDREYKNRMPWSLKIRLEDLNLKHTHTDCHSVYGVVVGIALVMCKVET
jgi:hypothetical protein